MTETEKQRLNGKVFQHYMESAKHPNAFTLQQMEDALFYGVGLDERYLAEAYRIIFSYLSQGPSRVHPSLLSMKLHEREDANGDVVEAWLSLESDGTTDRAPQGEHYRLTLDEVKNLWMLTYPYNK